jgi:hypothetical protein
MRDFLSTRKRARALGGEHRLAVPALALLIGLTSSAPLFAAGRVFYDGFDGTTNQWAQDEYRNRCSIVQSAMDGGSGPRGGAGMARCNWNGTLAWNAPDRYLTLKLPTWPYQKEFLIRFWVRADRDATDHPANGPKIYRVGGTSYAGVNFRNGDENAAFYGTSGQIGSTYWGKDPSVTSWSKYEIYVRQGTSDGVLRIWRDDNEVKSITGANTSQSSGSWAPFIISSNWSGATGCCDHDANNHVYWDEFEIYSDSGTGASGSFSDGSIGEAAGGVRPQPPLAVTVN